MSVPLSEKHTGIVVRAKEKNIIEIIENPTFVSKLATNDKDEAFLKTLKRSAKHAKEIGAGIRKGKSLDALLDEL